MATTTVSAPVLRISPPHRPLAKPMASGSSSPTSPTSPLSHDDRCVYRATECANPRARKTNGERHKFCQYHLRQTSLNQRAQCQRKQSKTLLFRDPSRVPAALLRKVPQTKVSSTHMTTSGHMLPRLRSHDVLRRALLADAHKLLPSISTSPLLRPVASHPPTATLPRLPSIHTLVPSHITSGLCSPRVEDLTSRSSPSRSCLSTQSSQSVVCNTSPH